MNAQDSERKRKQVIEEERQKLKAHRRATEAAIVIQNAWKRYVVWIHDTCALTVPSNGLYHDPVVGLWGTRRKMQVHTVRQHRV